MMNMCQRLSFTSPLVLASICLNLPLANADEYSPKVLTHSLSDFGGIGLLQMPSARMADDGNLGFNFYNSDEYFNYALSLQVFPWLESTIRYTQVFNQYKKQYIVIFK